MTDQHEGRLYYPSEGVNFLHGMLLALPKSFTILFFGKKTKNPKTWEKNVNC